MDIPPLHIAVEQFRDFLLRNGVTSPIAWVFKDDLCPRAGARYFVRDASSLENARLAEKVFSEGQRKGLVEITVVATSNRVTAATVWYPRTEQDDIQGWNQGMKLSIIEPLAHAEVVSSPFAWQMVRWSPSYRRYQASEAFVGTREWAVA